jgi:hypothetical protein
MTINVCRNAPLYLLPTSHHLHLQIHLANALSMSHSTVCYRIAIVPLAIESY